MKYPIPVFLMLAAEFCERFAYFTMQNSLENDIQSLIKIDDSEATLSLYLAEIVGFSKNTSVIIFHTYLMLIFFFTLMGAVVADSWLGKYRTLLYLSTVYALGQLLFWASSIPSFNLPVREISLLSLFLLALGTGGIKPCVLSFATDQFKLSKKEGAINGFIVLFFTVIYCSSIISIFISPILRKDITCFGLNTCYPIAFFVPSIFLILVVAIYFLGKPLFTITNPGDNVILRVSKCIIYAIASKLKSKEKRTHWLDHADSKYDCQLIEDTKITLGIGKLFILMSVHYAVFYQSHSRWIFQATHMDGSFYGYLIKPDQLQLVQHIMLLVCTPVCQYVIYPIIGKTFFINTPLRKMTVGGILIATSFVMSGILDLSLEPTYTVKPPTGLAHIQVFNSINCPVNLSLEGQMQQVQALGIYQNLNISVIGSTTLKFDVEIKCPNSVHSTFSGSIHAEEKKSLTYILKNDSLQFGLIDEFEKSKAGDPMLRALILSDFEQPATLNLSIHGKKIYHIDLRGNNHFTEFIEVIPDFYNISINGVYMENEVSLMVGGIYTIVGKVTQDSQVIKTVTVVQPNSIHILWQLPQYLVIIIGDIFMTVTGLGFALSQAPPSMKTVVLSETLLSIAIGNFIVIFIQKLNLFERQVFEYFLFAGLSYIGTFFFAIAAMSYKYVDKSIANEK